MQLLPEKIRKAALACLTVSRSSPDPLATAARFVDRLALQPGWTRDEAELIRQAILERLLPDGTRQSVENAA